MIHVYEQYFTEEDAKAAYDAVKSGVLSSFGPKVLELEEKFTQFIGRSHGLTCSNGTAALLLALIGADIKDCRVAVPDCTYAAVGFAPVHRNCRLEFIDVTLTDWNIDADQLDEKCTYWADKDPIKAVIAVHNFGSPYDYERLVEVARKHNLIIIEDACEALCGKFKNQYTGTLGDISVFSFYGNKLLASGEGGFILTDNSEYYNKMLLHRGQGQDPNRRFWHIIPGFNYRMTNVQAAIVLSQFNRIDQIQMKKLKIWEHYIEHLPSHVTIQGTNDGATHAWWMISIIGDHDKYYIETSTRLAAHGIETRPIFPALHSMPAFGSLDITRPVTTLLNNRGITLPSGPGTSLESIERICSLL